jgi:hypothetical protein
MSCTCAKKQYPCPVHRGGHLPVPEIVERAVFVIRISQRWGTNEKWFSTVTKDAVTVFIGSDRENHWDAILEATCFLNSQTQKPKEK